MNSDAAVSRDELIEILVGLNLYGARIPQAISLAESVHATQHRAGGGPYLDEHIYPITVTVARYLVATEESGVLDAVIVALLHDTIEDSTTVTEQTVKDQFGETIAEWVSILTKPDKRPGMEPDRSDQAEERYVARVSNANRLVRVVKVFDRLNNLAAVQQRDIDRRRRYLAETRDHYVDLAESVDRTLATMMDQLLRDQERRLAGEQAT